MNCWSCVWNKEIPGDCHLSCDAPGPTVELNHVGVRKGWCRFPFNFDPVWVTKCDSYEEKHGE